MANSLARFVALSALCVGPPAGALCPEGLAAALMAEQYGDQFIASHQCWVYAVADVGPYCMSVTQTHSIQQRDGERRYILSVGAPLGSNGLPDPAAGSHAAPGIVGSFAVLCLPDGNYHYLAAAKALPFGSFADSGAEVARFVQIGANDYDGWTFTSGGTWQGVSVGKHVILAPLGARFVDISTIPTMTENDQQHRYSVDFDASHPDRRVYPLIVRKWRINSSEQRDKPVATYRVPFDYRTWRYQQLNAR